MAHLQQVFLAAVHDVLRGQTVDHVAGVEDDEEEDHAEKEQGLRSGSLRPDFIQLHDKNKNILILLIWQSTRSLHPSEQQKCTIEITL